VGARPTRWGFGLDSRWAGPLGGFGFRRMARLLISDNRHGQEVKSVPDPIFITDRVHVRPAVSDIRQIPEQG
jgi:hypothetical protein